MNESIIKVQEIKKEVEEIIKNSNWIIDEIDSFDGFTYVTICKPN